MRGAIRWGLGALAAVVLAGLAVRIVPDTPAESDHAVTEILVLNVLHGRQAVGSYSRFGWNHPGPLYLQVLAPLYWLSGYRHLSVVVTVAVINAACLVALLALARRFAVGRGLAVAAVAVLAAYLIRMNGLLASSWNPHVGILPMALLVVCSAAAAAGAPRLLPWVIVLASFVIQAHLGTTLAALAIAATATAMVAIDGVVAVRRGERSRAPLMRTIGIAAGVGALLWALPAIDEVRPGGQHNLQQIYEFFRSHGPAAPRAADRAFERFFVAPFTPNLALWGETPPDVRQPLIHPVAIAEGVLLVIAAVVSTARRRRFESRLAMLSIVGSLAALIAIRRLPEYPKDYTVLWLSALGVMNWIAILAIPADAAVSWIARRMPDAWRACERASAPAVIVAILIAGSWQVAARHADEVRTASPIRALTAIVQARLDEADTRTPLVHMPGEGWGVVAAVLLQLYRAGETPHVDADWVSMFGPPFTPTGNEPVAFRFTNQAERDALRQSSPESRLLGHAAGTFVFSETPRRPAPR